MGISPGSMLHGTNNMQLSTAFPVSRTAKVVRKASFRGYAQKCGLTRFSFFRIHAHFSGCVLDRDNHRLMNRPPAELAPARTCRPKLPTGIHRISTVMHGKRGLCTGI